MPSVSVPWRRSLVVRLLAVAILVAVGSSAATAWLTLESTTNAIQEQQTRSLLDDNATYETLLAFAATHPSWDDISQTIDALGERTGRRVTLLTPDRDLIADSASDASPIESVPAFATVDPLHVTPAADTAGPGAVGSIDPRAVGPYLLTASQRRRLDALAVIPGCKDKIGAAARLVRSPSGRPMPSSDAINYTAGCVDPRLARPLPSEARALSDLTRLTSHCVGRDVSDTIAISPLFDVVPLMDPLPAGLRLSRLEKCVQTARREQLRPFVAPVALLFVTDAAHGTPRPSISVSGRDLLRIALGTAAILAVAVAVTLLAGLRLIRPLRRLTEAAQRPIDEQHPVSVDSRDEIGSLATALNDLAARRDQLEGQRTAMVSDVAHELRNPLTNIRSWLEAAQDDLIPTDPGLLDLLLEEAVLLQHIVDDLRDLAAADAGTLRIYPEFLFVNDVLSQVVQGHRGAADAAGVTLSTDYGTDLEMAIDPVRIRQLVGNLVSNAVRHTPPGGSVQVRTTLDDEALVLEVADTGTGIDAASLDKVFDRFWRADASRSRGTGGSGLGLPISRKLAEAHEGTISLTSTLGAGSTFTVRIPRTRQAPPPRSSVEPAAALPSGS